MTGRYRSYSALYSGNRDRSALATPAKAIPDAPWTFSP